jgi:NAD(P)-dependent dehydrogenase (short-subunit alcohol dehydrogenase family)
MAKAFAERGMTIVIADLASAPLEKARQELAALGADVVALQLDVTDRKAVKAAAADVVARFGAVHLVCANAGVAGHIGPLQDASDQDWDWIIDVNLKGSINTIQAFLPYLMKNGNDSHIVLTSSMSGLRVHQPSRGQGTYNTTKYALVGYGEALRVDLQPLGIGVSLLCPGVVNTSLSHSGENRPARYGGAFAAPADFELAKVASQGTDPLRYGRWVASAVERNQFYVITHTVERGEVEDRHRLIEQSFDYCAELTRS